MIVTKSEEDIAQLQFLNTPLAEKGSGCVRYAAAMYFFQRGMVTAETLEKYRIVSKLDDAPAIRAG